MKKLFLLLGLCASFGAFAQVDTTHAWQRVMRYYYEDTNWWNYYCFNVTPLEEDWEYNQFSRFPLGDFHSEFARHCYSDSSLKVIGVAAAVTYSLHENTLDTVMSHRPPEFLRLYEADGNGMRLVGEARCDTSMVRHRIAVEYWRYRNQTNYYYEEEVRDLLEVYFDEPIEVQDSFYVAGTQYGNQDVEIIDTVITGDGFPLPRTSYYYLYPVSCFWKTASVSNDPHFLFPSRPGYYMCRELSIDSTMPDGDWRYIADGGYLNIFPIIDTGYSASPENADQESDLLDIKKSVDQFTYVMPNPARSKVTIASSFRINKVEVYDVAGKRVMSSEPNGMSVSFDVSMLPKGVYSVRVSTIRGMANKRLIVE